MAWSVIFSPNCANDVARPPTTETPPIAICHHHDPRPMTLGKIRANGVRTLAEHAGESAGV
jgi:hypothetical protein